MRDAVQKAEGGGVALKGVLDLIVFRHRFDPDRIR